MFSTPCTPILRHRFVCSAANIATVPTIIGISWPQDQTFPFCTDQGSTMMCNTSSKVFGSDYCRQIQFHSAGFSASTEKRREIKKTPCHFGCKMRWLGLRLLRLHFERQQNSFELLSYFSNPIKATTM